MQHITDLRYPPGEEDSKQNRRLRLIEEIVQLKGAAVNSGRDYRKQQVLPVVSLKSISSGEELFVDYGMEYCFEWSSMKDLFANSFKSRAGKSG